MISTDSFFRVSSDRIDPDYGSDDGTRSDYAAAKVRFRGLRFFAIFWVF